MLAFPKFGSITFTGNRDILFDEVRYDNSLSGLKS